MRSTERFPFTILIGRGVNAGVLVVEHNSRILFGDMIETVAQHSYTIQVFFRVSKQALL